MDWKSLSTEEKDILHSLSNGSFQLSDHALVRMGERAIDTGDITFCAENAESIEFQPFNSRFVIKGRDTLDCEMGVVAEYYEGVLVVTVW